MTDKMVTVGTDDGLNAGASSSVSGAACAVLGTRGALSDAISGVRGSCEGVAARACLGFASSAYAELDRPGGGASSLSGAVAGANATLHEADDASASGWRGVD